MLTRIDARAVVEGPLAFTELHLHFYNPEDRIREGTFAISLPPGAAVSRFAMEIDGRLQEAEVVEKSYARRVFEDFLHRKQDPALLERGAGNQFNARVFPIPARADKHLVVSYSQELRGDRYTLSLRGLPDVAQVDVSLRAAQLDGAAAAYTLSERNWLPDRDFDAPVPSTAVGLTAGSLVVTPLALDAGAGHGSDAPTQLTLLVDTSASRALAFAGYVADVHGLIKALRTKYGAMLALRVVAFDQDHEEIFSGPAVYYGDGEDRALLARGAAGASNLAQAIEALAAKPRFTDHRVVVVTDGVLTAGPDGRALVAAIKRLATARLDVVLAGGIRNEQLAESIARAGVRAGDVFDLDRGLDAAATGLGEQVLTDVAIDVPGAAWVYPKTLSTARAGSKQLVFARMREPTQAIEVVVGDTPRTIDLAEGTPALLERAVARAEIEELERALVTADSAAAEGLRAEIAGRSVAARVISSQTSMLVLETERDYVRFQIARTALADILVVGEHGVEQTRPTTRLALTSQADTREHYEMEHRAGAARSEPADRRSDDGSGVSGGTGTAMALDEGRAGKEDSDRAEGQYRMQRNQEDPQLARQQAIEQARSAGLLGSTLTHTSNAGFASLAGTGGFDDINIYGSLLGNEASEMTGSFGIDRWEFGPGGGSGWGTIGTGRFGRIGYGPGGAGGGRGGSAAVPTVSIGQPSAQGDLDKAIIRRYIKRNIQKITYCYEKVLLAKPGLSGTVSTQFFITPDGDVSSSTGSGVDSDVDNCVAAVIKNIEFPKPKGGGGVQVNYPFTFQLARQVTRPAYGDDAWLDRLVAAYVDAAPATTRAEVFDVKASTPGGVFDKDDGRPSLSGKLAVVMQALRGGDIVEASRIASGWHADAPGDVLALIALGETLEANRDTRRAARIYGSIIDLYPARADLRRFAGQRLGRLGTSTQWLVIDTYRKAVADRPDHVTGHRLLAYALARSGDHAGAFAAILASVDQQVPRGRFAGADRVLRDDASILGAIYVANDGNRDHILAELAKRGVHALATSPSTRFVVYWETDANDVDFHIRDSRGGHASYQNHVLDSGGSLYADVTDGYGPECFAILGEPSAGPYRLSINYFSKGPMGYGMGLLQIQNFDGKALTFDDRPFVIMNDGAFADLGTYP